MQPVFWTMLNRGNNNRTEESSGWEENNGKREERRNHSAQNENRPHGVAFPSHSHGLPSLNVIQVIIKSTVLIIHENLLCRNRLIIWQLESTAPRIGGSWSRRRFKRNTSKRCSSSVWTRIHYECGNMAPFLSPLVDTFHKQLLTTAFLTVLLI